MSTLMWVLLGILLLVLYLIALVVVGFATLRKGHTILFLMGVIFPLFWVIGALMHPAGAVSTAEARRRLRQAGAPLTPSRRSR
jgi:hypothetical protein